MPRYARRKRRRTVRKYKRTRSRKKYSTLTSRRRPMRRPWRRRRTSASVFKLRPYRPSFSNPMSRFRRWSIKYFRWQQNQLKPVTPTSPQQWASYIIFRVNSLYDPLWRANPLETDFSFQNYEDVYARWTRTCILGVRFDLEFLLKPWVDHGFGPAGPTTDPPWEPVRKILLYFTSVEDFTGVEDLDYAELQQSKSVIRLGAYPARNDIQTQSIRKSVYINVAKLASLTKTTLMAKENEYAAKKGYDPNKQLLVIPIIYYDEPSNNPYLSWTLNATMTAKTFCFGRNRKADIPSFNRVDVSDNPRGNLDDDIVVNEAPNPDIPTSTNLLSDEVNFGTAPDFPGNGNNNNSNSVQ